MKFKNISLEATNEVFSANSGIILFDQLWEKLNLSKGLRRMLPKKLKNKGPTQINKFKSLLFSFAVGNDSLDDLDELREDCFFRELTDGGVAARTIGDFLRSFGRRHIERLQDQLFEMALALRMAITEDKKFILAMDSTPHEQCGKKQEGVSYNYKNYWCRDSQNAYDQYGFSYLFDLRPGNTYSGKDAEAWIHKIFSKIPENMERWFRADSAYSSHKILHALKIKNVNFAIVLRENIARYVRKKNKNILTWKKSKLHFFDSDKCEVAMGLYPIKRLGNLRVVFIRAPKENYQMDLFEDFQEGAYCYYSIITNVSSFDMSEEEVIDFYRQRSTAENYIKEQKYGFDFLNFPCQKMGANKVFGLVGTFAHNMMRFLSFCMEQRIKRVRGKDGKLRTVVQLGYFAKKVRNKLIKISCRMVRTARRVKLRLNTLDKEVLKKIMTDIHKKFSRVSACKT